LNVADPSVPVVPLSAVCPLGCAVEEMAAPVTVFPPESLAMTFRFPVAVASLTVNAADWLTALL